MHDAPITVDGHSISSVDVTVIQVSVHGPDGWIALNSSGPRTYNLLELLRRIAAYVDPKTLRKHPRKPKPKVKKGYASCSSVERYVATARVLAEGRVR